MGLDSLGSPLSRHTGEIRLHVRNRNRMRVKKARKIGKEIQMPGKLPASWSHRYLPHQSHLFECSGHRAKRGYKY